MATHSSILAWRIPWTEESGWLLSVGSQRIGHDWATNTFTFNHSIVFTIYGVENEIKGKCTFIIFLIKQLQMILLNPSVWRNTQVDFLKLLISPALSKKKRKKWLLTSIEQMFCPRCWLLALYLFHCKLTHPYWFMGNKSKPSKC